MWVNIATTKPYEVQGLRYSGDAEGLELLFPELAENGSDDGSGWAKNDKACMSIAVAIHVRKGVKLDDWTISTANLNVLIHDGLFSQDEADNENVVVRNETTISAIHGNVATSYWSSRRTIIETMSGQITGTYALLDLLSLKSQSGSIGVNVEPEKEDKDHPAPAEFLMMTSSGSVRASFPTDYGGDIPEREYTSRVETSSGSIAGSYILGSLSTFTTHSASIQVDVLPYSADLFDSRLETHTNSGQTRLTLLDPYTSSSTDSTEAVSQRYVRKAYLFH